MGDPLAPLISVAEFVEKGNSPNKNLSIQQKATGHMMPTISTKAFFETLGRSR
jgi:hypothetical protein